MPRSSRTTASSSRRWKTGGGSVWLTRGPALLSQVVPRDLPPTVVYPFGGGDLLTALVMFPKATEITTLSLEPAGDPRTVDALAPATSSRCWPRCARR